MKNVKKYVALGVVVIVVLAIGYFNFSVWLECRATNSFFYCMQVLNK
jgi:uncharacterized membrane protein YukC